LGKCPDCGAWNSLIESTVTEAAGAGKNRFQSLAAPQPVANLSDIEAKDFARLPTTLDELDRVLGGGLVDGGVVLIGGDPGIGKSTLLLQALHIISLHNPTLYVSGEESGAQIAMRARRLGLDQTQVRVLAEISLERIVATVQAERPRVCVIDSIQTIYTEALTSAPGSVAQVRECAAHLTRLAKATGVTVILVGHVTKEGGLAGPRVLEHIVDTVLAFEGDRHHALRMLRAVKHRFGATDQLGLFEMTQHGMLGVPDPSRLFLADRRKGVSGSVIVPTMEGDRPMLVEVQALVAHSELPSPRRSAQGLDAGRLSLLLAVLAERAGVTFEKRDVYALAVGGVKIVEPAADLGVALALASSRFNSPIPEDLVVCGEIGLGGELRQVAHGERRLAEAARLGFTRALVPRLAPDPPEGMKAIRVGTLAEAVAAVGIGHNASSEF